MDNVNKTLYIPLYGKAYVSKKGVILKDRIKQVCKGFMHRRGNYGYLIGWVLERKQTSFHVPSIDRL